MAQLLQITTMDEGFGESGVSKRIVKDTPGARVVLFHIKKGQSVPPHRNPSEVHVTVLQGKGICSDGTTNHTLESGDSLFYEPGEMHGFEAIEDLRLLAVIAPNPSSVRT